MKTELRPFPDYGLSESLALMNFGFSDYFVPIQLALPMYLNMSRTESVDFTISRIIYLDDEAVGVALLARRGWTSRLAAMSIAPASRGRGAGRAAMNLILSEASSRGDRSMTLEVIENNAPAVRLYESCGFKTWRRLVSYESPLPVKNTTEHYSVLKEVDIREVAALVTTHGLDELPWQISRESPSQSNPPGKAYQMDDAYIVISNPAAERIAIRSILVKPESSGQQQAARLIQAVMQKHPSEKWFVPGLCPEELGGLFEKLGFTRDELSQLQMHKQLV